MEHPGSLKKGTENLPPLRLRDKKVLVVGLGISGEAVASFLCRQGALVSVSDHRPADELVDSIGRLQSLPLLTIETGGHSQELFLRQDLIVVSPGVPLVLEVISQARKKGIPVIGELELAGRSVSLPLIGLTGTNGKTTTVTLLGELFAAAGFHPFVGGNIGTPAIEMARDDADWDVGILELSSFQLEGIEQFRPHVGIILNVTPDHQDRYPSHEAYLQAKMKIMQCQGRDDFLLLNRDDLLLADQLQLLHERWLRGESVPRPVSFSCRTMVEDGGCCLGGKIVCHISGNDGGRSCTVPLPEVHMPGEHNRSNLLAAFLAGFLYGLDPRVMLATISAFKGLPHRLEFVARVAGIEYVNDSKATNLDAVARAIDSFDQPIVLLLGGRDKGASFGDLAGVMGGRVRDIVPFGEAADLIARQLPHFYAGEQAANLREAVIKGTTLAHAGDVVLLSPGCASFDEFASYRHRGDCFKSVVSELASGALP